MIRPVHFFIEKAMLLISWADFLDSRTSDKQVRGESLNCHSYRLLLTASFWLRKRNSTGTGCLRHRVEIEIAQYIVPNWIGFFFTDDDPRTSF
jgi:hypothetical protein